MTRLCSPRALLALTAGVAVTAGGAVAMAQGDGPAPTVASFTLGKLKSTPTGPATLPAGAVTFSVSTKETKGDHGFQIFRLADGADVAATQAKLRKVNDGDKFEKLTDVTALGGTEVSAKAKGKSTFTLAPGTYLFGDFSDEKVTPTIPFTVVADPAVPAAVAPTPATSLTLQDYKFTLTGRLPRNGAVRVVNKGKRNHIVVTFKAQNAAGSARMVKALKTNNEKAFEKEVRGTGPGVNIIGPGETQDLAFKASKGSYVFVCFYSSKQSKGKEHFRLGMFKVATVK